ncbi:MAG: TetR/AcrR family transcriptional regulator [Polyangiales bacterium]
MPSRPTRGKSPFAARKQPRQQRSTKLVDAILEAAVRVLSREGAAKFNTVRVAERAGVSVGSLYQYFPNKQAILFRLQEKEWLETSALMQSILGDGTRGAKQRLRDAISAFFRTEHEEAPLRRALGASAPLFVDSPIAKAQHRRSQRLLYRTLREAAPTLTRPQLVFAGELYAATMGSLAAHVTDDATRSRADVERWAQACADMFLAHLETRNR